MGVGPHHHSAGKRIIFQHHLVDDAGTGLPETDAILGRHALQKAIYLTVRFVGDRKVGFRTFISLNQMVAMHRRRDCHGLPASNHELQQRHLCGGILHGHPVGPEIHIIFSPPEGTCLLFVIQVRIEDFLGQCQRPSHLSAHIFYIRRIRRVECSQHFYIINHTYSFLSHSQMRSKYRYNSKYWQPQ